MRGLIKKDLLIAVNLKIIISCLLLYLNYSFIFEIDMSFIFPFISLILFLSTFSYDDFNNWHLYAMSLPGGRIAVVKAKYITGIILILIGSIIGLLLGITIGITRVGLNFNEFFEYNLGIILVVIFIMSLLFPFLFKYGAEKGRLVMAIIGLIIAGIYLLLTKVVHFNFSLNLLKVLGSYSSIIFVLLSLLFISVSYFISKNIYLKREF